MRTMVRMMRTLTGSCKKNDNPVANKKNGDERTLELSQQEREHIRSLLGLQEIRAIAGEPLPSFFTAQSLLGRFKALEYLGRRDAPEGRRELVHIDC